MHVIYNYIFNITTDKHLVRSCNHLTTFPFQSMSSARYGSEKLNRRHQQLSNFVLWKLPKTESTGCQGSEELSNH